MKIKLELFGASRDFSDKDHLEIEIQNKASHNLGNLLFENKNYDEAIQEYFKTQKNSE